MSALGIMMVQQTKGKDQTMTRYTVQQEEDHYVVRDNVLGEVRMEAYDFKPTAVKALEDSTDRMQALLTLARLARSKEGHNAIQRRIVAEGAIYIEALHRCYPHTRRSENKGE